MDYIKETVNILKNLESLKKAEENLILRYKESKENLTSVKALNMSGMPTGSGGSIPDDRTCNLLFEQREILLNLKKTRKKLEKMKLLLEGLTEEEKSILDKSYSNDAELKNDSDIAAELKMSRRTYLEKKKKTTKKLAIQLWGIASL